jgi:hypothetical protein
LIASYKLVYRSLIHKRHDAGETRENAMKFILLAYESETDLEARGSDGSQRQGLYWAAWKDFGASLARAGVVESMHGLQPQITATTVSLKDGTVELQDGAYLTGEAELGGYFIIEVPNLDAAVEWAAKCPAALNGTVEVRPLLLRAA